MQVCANRDKKFLTKQQEKKGSVGYNFSSMLRKKQLSRVVFYEKSVLKRHVLRIM